MAKLLVATATFIVVAIVVWLFITGTTLSGLLLGLLTFLVGAALTIGILGPLFLRIHARAHAPKKDGEESNEDSPKPPSVPRSYGMLGWLGLGRQGGTAQVVPQKPIVIRKSTNEIGGFFAAILLWILVITFFAMVFPDFRQRIVSNIFEAHATAQEAAAPLPPPELLSGTWGGMVEEPGFGSYHVRFVFRGRAGISVYPNCQGVLRYVRTEGQTLVYEERIVTKWSSCVESTVRVQRLVEGRGISWQQYGGGHTTRAALLPTY